MNTNTTFALMGIAVILGVAAVFAVPSSVEPEAFNDQGEVFFPDLVDPFTIKGLEVSVPDADTGTVDLFNVTYEKGLWRIPSHNDYPADAKERVATAATAMIGLKKDRIVSDRVEDRALFGVEDPLDDASSVEGRGKRITLKDGSGRTLADLIVGKDLADHRDWSYIREPGNKRIYAVNLRPDPETRGGETLNQISTVFSEWIDTDLLRLKGDDIGSMVIMNYSVDEEQGKVNVKEKVELTRGEDDKWSIDGLGEEQQPRESAVRDLTRALDDLSIVGVRPTPKPLTQLSLASKGFFVNQEGELFGNEGQVEIDCKDGVIYHLYFGEVLIGSGEAVTAGTEAGPGEGEAKGATTENRYVFVRTSLDPKLEETAAAAKAAADQEAEELKTAEDAKAPEPEADADKAPEEKPKTEKEKAKEKAEKALDDAKKRVEELNLRFQDWYYVITDESFKKIRLDREALVEEKLPDTSMIGEQPENKTEPVKKSSGLAYIDVKRGTGAFIKDGDTVKVLYTGWLKDGTEFDKNDNRDAPFVFTVGEGQVIKGWDEGVMGMRVGGKRKLIVPSDLGYGAAGSGDKIPPHSMLVFDVELLSVEEQN